MSYEVVDRKIHTLRGCELNVTYHCNLSCRSCSHFSPTFRQKFVEPEQVLRDFSVLAKYYRPKYIRLLGGEPLLHRDLVQVIKAVRASEVSDRIVICTNGQLLPKAPDAIWQQVDRIDVSIYPGKELTQQDLNLIKRKARQYAVELQITYFDHFRESYSEIGTEDKELVQRIYATCKIAHTWRCHTVNEGYFYKCPLALFIPLASPNNSLSPYQDGIKIIDSVDFANNLLAYLNSSQPLSSCSYCLGTAGKLLPHQQQSRKNWRSPQQYPTEELIDLEFLNVLEENPEADDSLARNTCPLLPASNSF